MNDSSRSVGQAMLTMLSAPSSCQAQCSGGFGGGYYVPSYSYGSYYSPSYGYNRSFYGGGGRPVLRRAASAALVAGAVIAVSNNSSSFRRRRLARPDQTEVEYSNA